MSLRKYFQETEGTGVLSTANGEGKVNAAVYARPHFPGEDDRKLAFIMTSRRSYSNIQDNPHAAYLFMEDKQGYAGKRLYLKKTGEDASPETVKQLRRREYKEEEELSDRQVVYFEVENERPLVGDS